MIIPHLLVGIAILIASSHLAKAGVGCGIQAPGNAPNPKLRIINGDHAQQGSWPWIVSQQPSVSIGNPMNFCGGTLLRIKGNVEATDIVLTAGHCLKSVDKPNWAVAANLHWQSYQYEAEKRMVVKVKRHDKYVNFRAYDIALLKLDKPINFTETIRPICLPKHGENVPVGKHCRAAGWGRISKFNETHKAADGLQELVAEVHPPKDCERMKGADFKQDVSFCAGPRDGWSSTCNGDSGSMLACQADDGRWVQYGIVSYGPNGYCARANDPTVFSKVSNFVDWINDGIKELSSL